MIPDTLALPHFGAVIPCEPLNNRYGKRVFRPLPPARPSTAGIVVDFRPQQEHRQQAAVLTSQRIHPKQRVDAHVWQAYRSTQEGTFIDTGYLVQTGDRWTLYTGPDAKALKRERGLSWPQRLLRKVTGALSPGHELACCKTRGMYYQPKDQPDWAIFATSKDTPCEAKLVDQNDQYIATGRLASRGRDYQFTVTRSSKLWPLRQAFRDWLAPEPKYRLPDGD